MFMLEHNGKLEIFWHKSDFSTMVGSKVVRVGADFDLEASLSECIYMSRISSRLMSCKTTRND
jgi:hypothetical protein